MTRRSLSLLLAIIAMLLFATPAVHAEQPALTLTDMVGRDITLSGPANKIVALMPGDCEILYAIGAGDTLVGRGEWCNYPEEVLALPSVESGYQLNIEQVVSLAPEVIIMTKMGHSEEHIQAFEKAGIQVFVSDAQSIEDTYTAIGLLGALTGHGDEAEKIVQSMKDEFAALSAAAAEHEGVSVYLETTELQFGLWPAPKGSFMHEIAEMLNMRNVFDDLEGWQEVSEEEVIKRDADFIITTNMYAVDGSLAVDEVMARQGWQTMSAVKNGKVFNITDTIIRPAPRLVDAAKDLYAIVYGETE